MEKAINPVMGAGTQEGGKGGGRDTLEWGRVVTRRSTSPLATPDQLLLWPAKLRSANPRIKVISKYLKHRGLSAIPIPPATNDYGELKALWNMQGAHNNALQRPRGQNL